MTMSSCSARHGTVLTPCAPHNNVENCFLYQFHTLRKQFDFIASSWLHVQLLKSLRFACLRLRTASHSSHSSPPPSPPPVAKKHSAHVFRSAYAREGERVCLRLSGNSFQLLSYKLLYMPFRLYLRLSFFHLLQLNGTCSCKETSFIIYKMNILKLKLAWVQFHSTFCMLYKFFKYACL